jgi:DNA polymerase V
VVSLADLKEAIATSRAGEKLRQELLTASIISPFIKTNRFKDCPQYNNSTIVTLPVATNDTVELIQYALQGLQAIYREGYEYHKAGVMLLEITRQTIVQPSFLDQRNRDRAAQVMAVMDTINQQFGSYTLQFAVAGLLD